MLRRIVVIGPICRWPNGGAVQVVFGNWTEVHHCLPFSQVYSSIHFADKSSQFDIGTLMRSEKADIYGNFLLLIAATESAIQLNS
ncbi:hypothetical protein SAMN06273572_11312 [Monaibacterium marinum]|uniref:Uncharacterized protein n=1 Tax=Pontivivens marinum TaxID=1690039 RepID=A0A2C9CWJ9_9RHOB|nr:hypothetical protein SAMN06273572_11312 [Monaibacterium marinum]